MGVLKAKFELQNDVSERCFRVGTLGGIPNGFRVGTLMQRGVQSGYSERCFRMGVLKGASEWGTLKGASELGFRMLSLNSRTMFQSRCSGMGLGLIWIIGNIE